MTKWTAWKINGETNVRTCATLVKEGMIIETQNGLGQWKEGAVDEK